MRAEQDAREGRSGSEELLLRVAWFYYKDELTQDEIAKRLSVSRASVGRMLDRARKVGLVSINLNADHLNAFEVSRQLRAPSAWPRRWSSRTTRPRPATATA